MDNQDLLNQYRKEIDEISEGLVLLMAKREKLSAEILKVKKELGLPDVDLEREEELVKSIRELGLGKGIEQSFVENVLKSLIEEGKRKRVLEIGKS
ncbi:MAG: chorismate mutase [archaeon]